MPPDEVFRQGEFQAETADLVLEQVLERLDQLKTEFLGQAADVVVRLDVGRGAVERGAAFDNVGVKGALGEKAHVFNALGLVLEHVDKDVTDNAALFLRVTDAGQGLQEALASVDNVQVGVEMIAEGRSDRLGLPLTKQAVIDKDTGNLRANGPNEQRRGHRRVHAARQAADDAVVADALAEVDDRLLDERLHLPQPLAAASVVEEVAQHQAAVRRMAHFRMELEAIDRAGAMLDGGHGAGVGGCQRHEVLAGALHLVAMAHPDDGLRRHARE